MFSGSLKMDLGTRKYNWTFYLILQKRVAVGMPAEGGGACGSSVTSALG